MALQRIIADIVTKNHTDRMASELLGARVSKRNINKRDSCNETPLAFVFGTLEPRFTIAKLLLEVGANVKITAGWKQPLLTVSCDVVHTKLLLEGTSDISTILGTLQYSLTDGYDHHLFVQLMFIHDVLIEAIF